MCGVVFILGALGAGLYCLWAGIHGLIRGVVVDSGGYHSSNYSRTAAPLEYWLTETVLLALGLVVVPLFGGALFQKVRPARLAKTTTQNGTDGPKPP